MLFNSYPFVFAFLPLTLLGYTLIVRLGKPSAALVWVTLCSLFFYGWWNPIYLPLLIAATILNYIPSYFLITQRVSAPGPRRAVLVAGLVFNLGLLGYFKYANFFVDNLNHLGVHFQLDKIILPLGISFFIFQKIAYLADAYQGKIRSAKFLDYIFFVSFFPQLIAGPIVHHSEIIPQVQRDKIKPPQARNLALGLTLFFAGLFSKSVLADSVAPTANAVFAAAGSGLSQGFLESWTGALAYTLQLYFDFSGYSYMAIGLGLLFNIKLPANFNSPYRSTSIIEFWRRWHITLSNFLRDYLYIPLGGNRCGAARNLANLTLTMLLGGLWHGASWTFVLWGAFHGLLLGLNHAWRSFSGKKEPATATGRLFCLFLTFFLIILGWVLFRADSLATAGLMFKGMAGGHGLFTGGSAAHFPLPASMIFWLGALTLIALFCPNLLQIMGRFKNEIGTAKLLERAPASPVLFSLGFRWALIAGLLATAGICALSRTSEFLYFQF